MTNKAILLASIILSIIVSIFEFNFNYLFILVLAMFLIFYFGRNVVLALIIVSLIIATGETLLDYRPIITIISLSILLYFFISEFGLDIKNYPKVPHLIIRLILFLLFTVFLSIFNSTDLFVSIMAFLRFLIFFLICYLLFSQIKNKLTVYYYLSALAICVVFLGVSMLIEFVQKGSSFFINEGTILRLAGLYENPNYVGLLISITIPVTLSVLLLGTRFNISTRLFSVFFLFFQIILLILADSRASILAVFISSILIIYYSSKKIKLVFFISVMSVLLFLILFTNTLEIVELYLRLDRAGTRELFWQSGIEIISDHPLWGIGSDTFSKVFYSYSPSSVMEFYDLGAWKVGKPNPHNIFIYYWAENGILGFIAVFLFFGVLFKLIFTLISKKMHVEENLYPIVISIFSITAGLLVRSMFEITGLITYGFITRDLPFWILIIILIYIFQESGKTKLKTPVNN